MNNDSLRELLAENKARLWERGSWVETGKKKVVCYWPEIRREDLYGALTFLLTYGGVGNTVPGYLLHGILGGTKWTDSGDWWITRVYLDWLDPEKHEKLALFRVCTDDGDALTDIVTELTCRYRVETSYYIDAHTIPTLPSNDSALGITYNMGPVTFNDEDGTISTYIEKRTRLYQVEARYTSELSAEEQEETIKHYGVKSGDKNDSGVAILLPDMATDEENIYKELDRERNADCTEDIQGKWHTGKDVLHLDYEESAAQKLTRTKHTAKVAETDPGTPAVGYIKRVVNRVTRFFNRFETTVELIEAKDQTATDYAKDDSHLLSRQRHTEGDLLTEPDVPALGTVLTRVNRPTEFGKYETQEEIDVHQKQVFEATWSTKDGTGFYKNVQDGTDADLAADLATLTATTSNGVSGEKHNCGLNNYRLSKSTSGVGAQTVWQDVEWSDNTVINGTPTPYTVYVRYFATVTGAQNHMAVAPASGRISVGKVDGNNAGIRGPLAGNYIWEATRIELEWS